MCGSYSSNRKLIQRAWDRVSGVKGEKSLEIIVHVAVDLRRATVLGLDLPGWVKGQ